MNIDFLSALMTASNNPLFDTDAYKLGHFTMYPDMKAAAAYIEARKPYKIGDNRIVHFGTEYVLASMMNPITHEHIDEAVAFYAQFDAMGGAYPFPEQLFRRIVDENQGYMPVKIYALEDGQAVLARTPQLIVVAEEPYTGLVTWLETRLLSTIWYMSTVATRSRMIRTDIEKYFHMTVDKEAHWKLDSRLHDFAFRGVSSREQALMGGMAHLLSFEGTDTTIAAIAAKSYGMKHPNSIPATEHSVMTSWDTELDALMHMANTYGHTIFATVADSYNYQNFLDNILPQVAPIVMAKGGFHVIRPDSGDPVQAVMVALLAAAKAYGATLNYKGYKVLNNSGVIQGDGINENTIVKILDMVVSMGFSAENVAFGMGAGLLQNLNRDTCGYAMKLSYVERPNNSIHNAMKSPNGDSSKASLPGLFHIKDNTVYPCDKKGLDLSDNMLKLVYDNGAFPYHSGDFEAMRERVNVTWGNLNSRKDQSPWSYELTRLQANGISRIKEKS